MNFSTLQHLEAPPAKVDFKRCLEFCDMMRAFTDPEKLSRQKEMEKRIDRPFDIRGWDTFIQPQNTQKTQKK
jgi:hypothetical protein